MRDVTIFDGSIGAIIRREMARAHARRGNDQVRHYLKTERHCGAALAGGGSREVARRARQIAAGSLKVTS